MLPSLLSSNFNSQGFPGHLSCQYLEANSLCDSGLTAQSPYASAEFQKAGYNIRKALYIRIIIKDLYINNLNVGKR